MVQHWSPLSQLQRSPEPGVAYLYDHSKRIAIFRHVEVRGERLLRVVTYNDDPAKRALIGYFPSESFRLAAEVTWSEYVRATGPSTSNRK